MNLLNDVNRGKDYKHISREGLEDEVLTRQGLTFKGTN